MRCPGSNEMSRQQWAVEAAMRCPGSNELSLERSNELSLERSNNKLCSNECLERRKHRPTVGRLAAISIQKPIAIERHES